MPVITATDESVREQISNNDCVFVAYISPACNVCRTLMPSIEKIATEPRYENIVFIKIDADENPVAKIEMHEKQLPFVVTYKKGLLIECETISTEYDVAKKLEKLACAP
jgi:thioredoxin-like negative regulator of GroEL